MRRAHVGFALTLAVGLGGCETPSLDRPDGAPIVDGSPGQADGSTTGDGRGIVARLAPDPEMPVTFDSNAYEIEIERVRMTLTDVRFIGDNAPGDERTSVSSLDIEWRDGDGDVELDFEDAPPGIYSKLRGSVVWLEVRGSAESAEESYDWEVERDSGAPLSFDVDLGAAVLEAGGTLELDLGFDAAYPVAEVPWGDLEPDAEGEVEIDEGAIMDDIEARIAGGFHRGDVE